MSINGVCKCGSDPVTNAVEGLSWHLNGCPDCGEAVKFDVNHKRPERDKK